MDYDDDDTEGTLLPEDMWEDTLAINGIREKYPDQYIMKVIGYRETTFGEIQEWLEDNCRGKWVKHGWSGYCSYTVAVIFWDHTDAILYRMRWQ